MSEDVRNPPAVIVYRLHGELAHLGPLSETQVRELIARGKASSATLASIGDDPALTPLGEISAFAACFVTKLAAPLSAGHSPRAQTLPLSAQRGSGLIIIDAAARPARALPRWLLGAAAVVALVVGVTQFHSLFMGDEAPACDSSVVTESVLNRFKAQHADFAGSLALQDVRALSAGKEERSCAAALVSKSGETAPVALEYRVFLENKLVETQIAKADFPPLPKAPVPTAQSRPSKAPDSESRSPASTQRQGGDADAEACQLKGEPDRVIAACSRLLARDALDGVLRRDGFRSRGVAYYRRGDYDRALADLAESIRLAPGVAGLYGDQANVYYFKRDYSRAIAGYDKALQLDPNDALAYNNRGCAWVAVGSLAAAEADLNRARQNGVMDPGGACRAALVSLRSGQRANP